MSERKEQAIYDAVHEAVMKLRVQYEVERPNLKNFDTAIAQTQHAAGMAAIAAYKKPLPRKKR